MFIGGQIRNATLDRRFRIVSNDTLCNVIPIFNDLRHWILTLAHHITTQRETCNTKQAAHNTHAPIYIYIYITCGTPMTHVTHVTYTRHATTQLSDTQRSKHSTQHTTLKHSTLKTQRTAHKTKHTSTHTDNNDIQSRKRCGTQRCFGSD